MIAVELDKWEGARRMVSPAWQDDDTALLRLGEACAVSLWVLQHDDDYSGSIIDIATALPVGRFYQTDNDDDWVAEEEVA